MKCNEEDFSIDSDGYLFSYKGKAEFVRIPDNVTSIGSYAFQRCKKLKNIYIPDSVIEIGYQAFAECENLTGIKLPSSVKKSKVKLLKNVKN